MIRNGQSTTPHTFNVVSTTGFPPPATPLSFPPSGGSTLGANYASGSIAPNGMVGPVTLTAGQYFIGCAFHYAQGMRTVLTVAANATPGPQATPSGGTPTPSGGGSGFTY
jgi:hypothetical protein